MRPAQQQKPSSTFWSLGERLLSCHFARIVCPGVGGCRGDATHSPEGILTSDATWQLETLEPQFYLLKDINWHITLISPVLAGPAVLDIVCPMEIFRPPPPKKIPPRLPRARVLSSFTWIRSKEHPFAEDFIYLKLPVLHHFLLLFKSFIVQARQVRRRRTPQEFQKPGLLAWLHHPIFYVPQYLVRMVFLSLSHLSCIHAFFAFLFSVILILVLFPCPACPSIRRDK